jgi:hypothetical protein
MGAENPFRNSLGITYDVHDRLIELKSFSAKQCRAVIRLPNIQKTVRLAAERRLRKLGRAS